MADHNNHSAAEEAERLYRETLAQLERLATKAMERIPSLVTEQRCDIVTNRLPDRNLDTVFALKLIQLVGNLKSGEVLVRHGHYFEWDMVKRLVYETLDDLHFLALGEANDHWTKVHEQYMEALFAEDFDEDGSVVDESVRPVQRWQITDYLKSATHDGNEEEIAKVTRSVSRLHSASVHGRVTGIIRGYYEAPEQRFWTGGCRHEASTALERFSLHLATLHVTAYVAHLICPRWWGRAYRQQTWAMGIRLQDALRPNDGPGAAG